MANPTEPSVVIQGDSKERVALDLLKLIASKEFLPKDPKKHLLELYRECYEAVAGGSSQEK